MAGRVLVAVGDATALRAGSEIRLVAGTPVETGDTLRVGDASNLQVRFTDEAIMALRPNTTMRIDDYAFTRKAESDKSIFSLLKGGLRTITGFIGRNSRENYAVKAETSTIGIRGTHFNIVHCNNDCRNPDGSIGQNGTFGGVTDGRIAVTNNAGEREFGKNEFFFVASRDALPAGLIAPPSFLRDRLEGQAKSKGKGKDGGEGGDTAQASGNTSTTTQLAVAPQPVIVDKPYVIDPVINQSVLVSWAAAGADYLSPGGIWSDGTGPLSESFTATQFNVATSVLASYEHTYTTQEAIDRVAAGNVHWGVIPVAGTPGEHWAYGEGMTVLPTTGTYLFNRIGGTTPKNNEGYSASSLNTPAFELNFTANTVTGSIGYTIPRPQLAGGANVDYLVSISGSITGSAGTTTVSCTPACPTGVATSDGTGFGSPAKGLAIGVATYAEFGGYPQTTATVQVYKASTAY
ncbi:MAG: FecR family protein [Gammaproteobacteria bacterium]|nr:FecR family protein [Gammaproteobacteria bacterium]